MSRRVVVEAIHSRAIAAGHEMSVDVDGDLNRAVPHLLLLDQQRRERAPEIVEADPAHLPLLERAMEHMTEVRFVFGLVICSMIGALLVHALAIGVGRRKASLAFRC